MPSFCVTFFFNSLKLYIGIMGDIHITFIYIFFISFKKRR
nr:MAG TPA: hypothetical protein [Caudoviricetes sp.]